MTTAEPLRERCPNGARSRVLVNLKPEEMADLKARAEKEGRTYSNLARLLIIRSMKADRDSSPTNAT